MLAETAGFEGRRRLNEDCLWQIQITKGCENEVVPDFPQVKDQHQAKIILGTSHPLVDRWP